MVDQCSPNDCDPMSPIFEADFQTAAYKDLNVSVPVRRGNMPASKPRFLISPFPGWLICFSDFCFKICHQIWICIGKSPPISQKILLSLRAVLMKISISAKKYDWSALYGSGGRSKFCICTCICICICTCICICICMAKKDGRSALDGGGGAICYSDFCPQLFSRQPQCQLYWPPSSLQMIITNQLHPFPPLF